MRESTPTNLTRVAEAGGYRHYLDSQPIHAGDVLDYFDMAAGVWTSARFELIPGHRGRKAVLFLAEDYTVPVDVTTRLRWTATR
jgi:hypothetical protein